MNTFKSYFDFTHNETNAALILVCITCVVALWPSLYAPEPEIPTDFTNFLALAAKDTSEFALYPEKQKKDFTSYKEQFTFNPNTVSLDQLKRLGFKKYFSERLIRYRNAGGKFKQKTDLYNVYGVDSSLVKAHWTFIDLPERKPEHTFYENNNKSKQKEFNPIELNTADTSRLIALPGIGNVLAKRIIAFRNSLGGFYSVDQVQEVFGLKPETFEKIKSYLTVDTNLIVTININTADKKTLSAHPYIRYKLADALINYRQQHGRFTKVSDLNKMLLLDEGQIFRLKCYVKF